VEKVQVKITDEEKARQERVANRPPLDEILNLHDFEVCQRKNSLRRVLSRRPLQGKPCLKKHGHITLLPRMMKLQPGRIMLLITGNLLSLF